MSQNFPCYEKGQRITAPTVGNGAVLLGDGGARVQAALDVLLYNPGPNLVYVLAGPSDTTQADNTCAPLPAGAIWAYRKGAYTYLSAIAIGGAQDIVALVAEGS